MENLTQHMKSRPFITPQSMLVPNNIIAAILLTLTPFWGRSREFVHQYLFCWKQFLAMERILDPHLPLMVDVTPEWQWVGYCSKCYAIFQTLAKHCLLLSFPNSVCTAEPLLRPRVTGNKSTRQTWPSAKVAVLQHHKFNSHSPV